MAYATHVKTKDGVFEVERKENGEEVAMRSRNMRGFFENTQISLKRAGGKAGSV